MQLLNVGAPPSCHIGQALRCGCYVASDLVSFVAPPDHMLARDMGQGDSDTFRTYRRLDLAWFAYLAHKMDRLSAMDDAGEIQPSTAALMRSRWAMVQAFALRRYGLRAIDRATITPPDARYETPKVRKGSALLSIGSPRLPAPPDPRLRPASLGERVLSTGPQRAA